MIGANLLLRDVEIGGLPHRDVRIRRGVIAEIDIDLRGHEEVVEGNGGALIPGLIDHHAHLLASAAATASVDVGPGAVASPSAFVRALRAADAAQPEAKCLRACGYHETVAGSLTRGVLDAIVPSRPLRVQHATGSLWVLNSAALRVVTGAEPLPDCVERDAAGEATGRVWRGDTWLRARIGAEPPDLRALSARLARAGVTGICDASATTDDATASLIAQAVRDGDVCQRLLLMSAAELAPSPDDAFTVGPVKILLDDGDLPDFGELAARVTLAHAWRRNAAIHCVTAGELAFALAAFETAGVRPGDRIEHGGIVHDIAVARIAELGLTVVTQPGFIAERGDRYLSEVPSDDHASLYRCATLLAAGVKVAGSTDAPYTTGDAWAAIRAAVSRRTHAGRVVGKSECISPARALQLFLGSFADPGGPPRRVETGAPADLCLLDRPLRDALREPHADHVAATIIGGRVVHARRPVVKYAEATT